MRYLFSEPRRLEALANGKTRCYYDETISEEPIITASDPDASGDQASAEPQGSVTVYSYAAVDIEGEVTKARLVDALVRTRYAQSDVEAILRHVIAGAEGSQDEFAAFDTFAEACKTEAVRILGETAE